MIHGTLGRYCYAGYHLDQTGQAFDFQGVCDPGSPPPEQSKRICELPFYQHPDGSVFYDVKGWCDPTLTVIPMRSTSSTNYLMWILGIGVVAIGGYYIYKRFSKPSRSTVSTTGA